MEADPLQYSLAQETDRVLGLVVGGTFRLVDQEISVGSMDAPRRNEPDLPPRTQVHEFSRLVDGVQDGIGNKESLEGRARAIHKTIQGEKHKEPSTETLRKLQRSRNTRRT